MKRLTQAFLKVHWDRTKPLLLGYSGGPDSKALLYALLECDVKPHLAHVDHGWREESAAEAEKIRLEAAELGCPFHTVRLQLKEKQEDAARVARFSFFRSLLSAYQALLLAHQADDLAETVLKRILEGAHLSFLGGMAPISQQNGLVIWRPFLTVKRLEVLQFLKERNLLAIIDPSNSDPAYLRVRLRGEILPLLNEKFGKKVTDNLTLLSERAFELKSYLDKRTALVTIHKKSWGMFVELEGLERIEQRHLLQKMGREVGVVLSRSVIEVLLNWVKESCSSKHLTVKTKKILVEKGRVCVIFLDSKDSIPVACG